MLTTDMNLQITFFGGAEGAKSAIEERKVPGSDLYSFHDLLRGGLLELHCLVMRNRKVHSIVNCLLCVLHQHGSSVHC